MSRHNGHKQPAATESPPTGPVSVTKDGRVRIECWIKPGAKTSQIVDVTEEGLGVQVID